MKEKSMPRIPGKRRSKGEIAFDRKEIASMIKRGYSKYAIAEKLGVEYRHIASDYKQILRSVAKATKYNTSTHIAKALAELEEVKREAWEAWEKSKKNAQKKVIETVEIVTDEGTGERTKVIKTIEGRIPDAKFLNVIEKCIDNEKKLLGLDAAKKVDLNIETDIPWQKLAGRIIDESQLKKEVDELINDGLLLPSPEKEVNWDTGIPNISPGEEVEYLERSKREKERDNSVIILSPEDFEVKDPENKVEIKPLMEEKEPIPNPIKKLTTEKKKRRGKNEATVKETSETSPESSEGGIPPKPNKRGKK